MKQSNQLIIGNHSLREVLKSSPERILKVYSIKEDGDVIEELIRRKIPVKKVSKEYLNSLVETTSHQNIVAEIRELLPLDFSSFLERDVETSTLLILDSIYDPQNLGALFRCAECFGVDALLWSKNRGGSISPVVSKTSSGASELVDRIIVSNLAEACKRLQDAGFEIVAAHYQEGATPLHTFTFPKKTALIMGSEGKGVQPLLLKRADHIVSIPMEGAIRSLNVSGAAHIFLAQRYFSQKIILL